jgi:glycosyltransferase involved in cell wall biosynthesis
MAGPLFRELAEDLAQKWPPGILFTGHPDTLQHGGNDFLTIMAGPKYSRAGIFSRLRSWLHFFIKALLFVGTQPKGSFLLIVSNPPFLGLLGLFFKKMRGQKYAVLVYDIYPDLLIGLGRLQEGILAKIWDHLNRIIYRDATLVFTIGKDMTKRLEAKLAAEKTPGEKIVYTPCWADLAFIKPLPKGENWFAKQYGQIDKTTVLYSGNMGNAHDIESILATAILLASEPGIHFLFIGEGTKWNIVEKAIMDHQLQNITLLPFQPEGVLPYSLTAGDIGIIAYQPGTEGCMVPSKTYYYLAAGLAVLAVSDQDNDVAKLVKEFHCGLHVKNSAIEEMANAIRKLHADPELLDKFKRAARETAENFFSRRNSGIFAEAISDFIN